MEGLEDWRARFWNEVKQAETARSRGNEGMCRVCARRAAGIAAWEYLNRRGMATGNLSAFQRLKTLKDFPDLPARIQVILEHLTIQVNYDHQLPADVDLLSETIEMSESLFGSQSVE